MLVVQAGFVGILLHGPEPWNNTSIVLITAERELAKAAAKDLVSEDGPVHKSPGPSTFAH